MTGFIRGLFGTRKKAEQFDEEAQPQKQGGAYFLTPDDARTFGDIDYMRTAKQVKRTFPKGNPRVRDVSALSDLDASGNSPAAPASQPMTPPTSESKAPEKKYEFDAVAQRRKTDTSMDMFRNMAKDIRKG
ncbi:MAG: hypothetical protein VKK04_03270 [Synechococcales bacterium]|nr:hypothetical protein [Synechococcales bacterium]